jgi:signal transduction histidine kinase
MRSLRSRLWLLWLLAALASLAVALLLVQLYRTAELAEVDRAQAVAARRCQQIGNAYSFYVAGWTGAGTDPADPGFRRDLVPVLRAALAGVPGITGGIWSAEAGPLAFAGPNGSGVDADPALSAADQAEVQAATQAAAANEQSDLQQVASGDRTVLVAACPLPGPFSGLTAWTLLRVQAAPGYDRLRLGLGLLAALVFGMAGWASWLAGLWGRHVRRIETALAEHDLADLPPLPPTGERELDRIVTALNDAAQRLAASRVRAAAMAEQVARNERLAALGRVAAGVAHEIRNPVAAMRLRIENALAGDPSRLRPALETSLGQIARVDRLITELLAMTQHRTPAPQSIDLSGFLAARAAEHQDAAQRAGLRLDVASPQATARFDPEMIGRALDNLLLNAIRHTPAGGAVRLTAEPDAGDLRLTVADTGPGVDPALRTRLFEPFATGRPDGTGLGLAIVREMVEAHGGHITLAEAAGATFVIELPGALACRPS